MTTKLTVIEHLGDPDTTPAGEVVELEIESLDHLLATLSPFPPAYREAVMVWLDSQLSQASPVPLDVPSAEGQGVDRWRLVRP